jgi:citrate lyase subunit beta/citryl-CoA lyase
MTVDVNRLRSWMFVPTSPAKFLEKVSSRPVDAIMPDLEDGIVASERPAGREHLRRWLAARTETFPVPFVRINNVAAADWQEDVAAAIGATGVVLPKAESAAQLAELDAVLTAGEVRAGLEPGGTMVVAAIESAAGLLAASEIAGHPRVVALLFGAEDYALDLGLSLDRRGAAQDLVVARSSIVIAARSRGAAAIDGVHTNLDDIEGLVAQSRLARELGFIGKSSFHPDQIAEINRAFSPDAEEIAFARAVITGFDDAQAKGSGAVAVGGHLVDLPIAERARRLVTAADLLAERDARRALA